MAALDANLLVALDALLQEHSVTKAAERLHTSPAAMSRTLGRIRRVLGDPMLVRAGQAMVLTPRALAMREEVRSVVERCTALLITSEEVDLASLSRTFTVQTSDLLLAELASELLAVIARDAPGVMLRFLSESVEDSPALREGRVDVEIGVLDHLDPETCTAELTRLTLSGAVRAGHPLSVGTLTPARFASAAHISVSRRGRSRGPIDDRLAELGLRRRVAVVLPSHTAALILTARSDLVCLAAPGMAGSVPHALGLHLFDVPLELPPLVIGMAWHPRHSADLAHRWLRNHIRDAISAIAHRR